MGTSKTKKLINQNEGKEELDSVSEQENGVEDKAGEEAEVVEKSDEETDVDKGDEEAEVMVEETEVVDRYPHGESRNRTCPQERERN